MEQILLSKQRFAANSEKLAFPELMRATRTEFHHLEQEQQMWEVILKRHGVALLRQSLKKQALRIGRCEDNQLQLLDPRVSRYHCCIEWDENQHWVVNLSRNGVWLNGKPIQRASITLGDVITFGEWEVHIAQCSPPPSVTKLTEPTLIPPPQAAKMGIVAVSPAMRDLFALIERVAPSSASIAIHGESGTGKEVIARAVHTFSQRSSGPFVPVNCGALPESMIEGLLFGHERGAFTGAVERCVGVFEMAHGGTLFLDEIGELPLALQSRLLRVLEDGKIRRLGSRDEVAVDVRLVTATHRSLAALANAGRFREDLFYRLFVVPIHVPPLRERTSDIEPLARHFISQYSQGHVQHITPAALRKLQLYRWPGNVRELRNAVQRAALTCKNGVLDEQSFQLESSQEGISAPIPDEMLKSRERETIANALIRYHGNRSHAARALGIDRTTLSRKIKRLGIQ